MKKLFAVLGVLLLTSGAFAVITGSAHDFQGYGWSGGEICVPCHTPHNALVPQIVPLWNHTTAAGPWNQYVDVGTGTFDAGPIGQPAGVSLACLSCHDGTVAVDAFGGAVGATMVGAINPAADFTADLSNDHPISFPYTAALAVADGELSDPTVVLSGLGGTIDADMLFATNLECASCHDVHNTTAVAGTPLLRITNAGSAICLTCHNK